MCVIKFNGTHTLQGFHEDDHRIVRRTCEFFCGYIVLAGQRQAPAAAIKSLYFYRLFDVPTTQSEGHLSRMRTSLLWTKLLFSDKIEFFFFSACYDQINQVGRDPVRWGQFSATLYISCKVNNFSTLTVESTPRPVRALNCSLNYMLPISIQRCRVVKCQTLKKKKRGGGVSNNFIGIKLLNLSKDV